MVHKLQAYEKCQFSNCPDLIASYCTGCCRITLRRVLFLNLTLHFQTLQAWQKNDENHHQKANPQHSDETFFLSSQHVYSVEKAATHCRSQLIPCTCIQRRADKGGGGQTGSMLPIQVIKCEIFLYQLPKIECLFTNLTQKAF